MWNSSVDSSMVFYLARQKGGLWSLVDLRFLSQPCPNLGRDKEAPELISMAKYFHRECAKEKYLPELDDKEHHPLGEGLRLVDQLITT